MPAPEDVETPQPAPADPQPGQQPAGALAAAPQADDPFKDLTPKQALFVDEYLTDLNGTQAYMRAFKTTNANSAAVEASRLLGNPKVQAAVARRRANMHKRLEIDVDTVLKGYLDRYTADPRELVEFRRVCCPFCHGPGFKKQFTPSGMEAAQEAHTRKWAKAGAAGMAVPEFDERGGVGYDQRKPPHPDCPECHGFGEEKQLIKDIGRAFQHAEGEEYGWLVLMDVGAGEWRDKSVVVVAKVSGYGQHHEENPRRVDFVRVPIHSNTLQPTALVGEVMNIARALSNATVLVDAGGVFKRLEELGVPNVLWGNPCFKKGLKNAFLNQRAHAMVTIARTVKSGHVTISEDCFTDNRSEEDMLDQGSRIPYHFNDKGQFVIESKRSKAWEGLPSPDIWDAMSFVFLEDATYIVSDVISMRQAASPKAQTLEKLTALMADALSS